MQLPELRGELGLFSNELLLFATGWGGGGGGAVAAGTDSLPPPPPAGLDMLL